MKYLPICILLILLSDISFGQKDTLKSFKFSGYGELYYSYDISNPKLKTKPDFLYNHKRNQELNINLSYVKVVYRDGNIRANGALMVGNYVQFNYAAEPHWAEFIYEANIGVKLSKKHNLWLDAGIIPSHIGFESAVSADCWTLTRSMLAENSPYYESGVKVSYTSQSEKFNTSVLYLNGWQRIQKPEYVNKPSLGFQFNYKPNANVTLNYSNFIGTDKNDSINSWRLYHNFYMIYEVNKRFGVIAGFDIGTDKYNAFNYSSWYSPVLIIRYKPAQKYSIALRGEYYKDQKQILITTNTISGFRVFGTSLNFDCKIKENLIWRIEAKEYFSEDKIFQVNNNNHSSITTSLAIIL